MSEQHSSAPSEPVLSPVQKHKYTALLYEVKALRDSLHEARETIAALEHELASLKPEGKREEDLSAKLISFLGPHFEQFTRTERHLLKLFLKKTPSMARHAEVMDWLYAGVIDPPMDKIRDVYISKLRGKFKRLGIKATLITVWGEGWKLIAGPDVEPGSKTFILKSQRGAHSAPNSLSEIKPQLLDYELPSSLRGKRHGGAE